MMVAFVVGLCVVNIALWIVFIFRFKRIFSTDSIIEKTRNAMNRMVSDMNRNTETAINLSEEACRKLKISIKESEKILKDFSEATDRLRSMIAETEKMSLQSENEPVVNVRFRNNTLNYSKNMFDSVNEANAAYSDERKQNRYENFREENLNPDAAYEIKFGNNTNPIIKDETKVTYQGAAYKEVPVIKAKLFDESLSSKNSKKSINDEVMKLYDEGLNVEEIALQLSVSITEVQFIIDMNV